MSINEPNPTSQIVDSNDDKLDDRLVSPNEAEAESVRVIVKRVQNLTLSNLSVGVLEKMLEDIDRTREELLEQAREAERRIHADLAMGSMERLERDRLKIRTIGREFDELDRKRVKTYDALQERIIMDGMAKTLGSEGLAKFLEGFVLVLILFVLGLLTYEMTAEGLTVEDHRMFFYIDAGCCAFFLAEFFLRWRCSNDSIWFWKHNWIEFVTSIPIPAYSFLRYGRSLRLVRLIRLLRVIRALRVFMRLWHGFEKLEDVLDVRMMKKSLVWLIVIMVIGTFAIFAMEGHVLVDDAKPVGSLAESAWWSFTTVVTGGFGDLHNPDTSIGRVLTVILIISGMIVTGVFTATLTSLYMAEETEDMTLQQERLEMSLEKLEAGQELAAQERAQLREQLRQQQG